MLFGAQRIGVLVHHVPWYAWDRGTWLTRACTAILTRACTATRNGTTVMVCRLDENGDGEVELVKFVEGCQKAGVLKDLVDSADLLQLVPGASKSKAAMIYKLFGTNDFSLLC
jgi:hypothetical protein